MNSSFDFIPYAFPDIGEEEINEVVNTLRSGWITTGPQTLKFENNFAEFIGNGVEAIAVNSATAGLHLGLEALGVGPDDEVITTTHTFTATAEVIRYLGAHPIFVDCYNNSLCIDVSKIEAAITKKTRVIIPVHFGGLAAHMEPLFSLAKKHRIKVLEDAAHALPTTYKSKLIGSLESDVTVFSFYANKTMTTGEGGMLVTQNKDIAKRARVMRLHGINRDAFDRFTAKTPSWYYEIVAPGFKYNMTDNAAAIGIHQLKKVEKFQQRRQAIARQYSYEFEPLPLKLPLHTSGSDIHAWHLYVVRLSDDAPLSRDIFIEKMFELNIGCSVHYIPLHLQPYWRDAYQLTPDMFPVSQKAYEQSVSLPIYSKMSDDDVSRVISAVKTLLS